MLTIDLEDEWAARVLEIARHEHQTPRQIIQQALDQYFSHRQPPTLLVTVAETLPIIEAFAHRDPREIQQVMRDEWS